MITIAQNAEGTLVHGTSRGDGSADVLKPQGFRWSGRLGAWYFPRNRRVLLRSQLDALVVRLTNAGFEAEVELEEAEVEIREALRAERIEGRQEALENKAERRDKESDAHLARAHMIGQSIPFGQPILVGHHSEGRHRKDIERIDTSMRKGMEAYRESKETQRRADASRANEAARMTAPVTLRRIERLGAELRILQRRIVPCPTSGRKMKPEASGQQVTCSVCYHPKVVGEDLLYPHHGAPTGAELVRVQEMIAALEADIAFWQGHIATLEAGGVKLWGPDDVKKGDYVQSRFGWHLVVRVNKKSVSVKTEYSWTDTLPYSEMKGVRSPNSVTESAEVAS